MQNNNKYIALTVSFLIALLYVFLGIDPDEASQIKNDSYVEEYVVERVIDGDTFDVTTGERVRMIGIDTPERGKYFFDEATNRLQELIGGKTVILKKDISETDRYGRVLRHVYVDDIWINKQMIEEGYAKLATFPPDVYHVDIFKKAQEDARENNLGLWESK